LKITSSTMLERSHSTVHRKIAAFIPVLVVAILAQLLPSAPKTSAQSAAAPAELRISGAVSTPLVLTVADLKKMPRKTLSVVNPHDKKKKPTNVCFSKNSSTGRGYRKASNFGAALWPLM
jgi:hypothetical protein